MLLNETTFKPRLGACLWGLLMLANCASPVADSRLLVSAPPASDTTCPSLSLAVTRERPQVTFLIDRSSSMFRNHYPENSLGSPTRWQAACDALTASDGLIPSLEMQAEFGLVLFHAQALGEESHCDPVARHCINHYEDSLLIVDSVAPALNNAERISETYSCHYSGVTGGTPTGMVIDAVRKQIAQNQPSGRQTTVFVLVTDGQPTVHDNLVVSAIVPYMQPATAFPPRILEPNGLVANQIRDLTVVAAQQAFRDGIRTYVIRLEPEADRDQGERAHLDRMASAGVGWDPTQTPPAPSWSPGNAVDLRETLFSLVGEKIGCEMALEGEVTDLEQACTGTVQLRINGALRTLDCDAPDGWSLVDTRHVRLQGQACRDLQGAAEVEVSAEFPCGVARLI